MKHQFGVTIATSIEANDIRDTQSFNHVCVVDLRRCVNNGPFPIDEAVLRRMANFRVAYEQMPTSLYSASSRQENDLLRVITDQKGDVLVITDHAVPMIRFCKDFDIPFRSKDKIVVENSVDYVPVQLVGQKSASNSANFGSFG